MGPGNPGARAPHPSPTTPVPPSPGETGGKQSGSALAPGPPPPTPYDPGSPKPGRNQASDSLHHEASGNLRILEVILPTHAKWKRKQLV